ncbi:MAG TPA: hypothetical protein VJ723_00750 [Candidatus Angelobacter sp.]|nr:hypothetical protein [Candidatus Angelobacter sp.]
MDYLPAETNSLLVETLQEYEQGESARLEGITRAWDRARDDPDDVFFKARDRREEIKQEIEALLEVLTRNPQRSSVPRSKAPSGVPKRPQKVAKRDST